MPTLSIERRTLAARPVLFIRRRIARDELAVTLAECFGAVFGHCQKAGLPLDGRPYTRYVATGPGLWTIEAGKPLAAAAPGEGDIEAGTLPGGPATVAIHTGPYDQLQETYAAMERWIEELEALCTQQQLEELAAKLYRRDRQETDTSLQA